MRLKETLKKQGGMLLLKQYAKSGALVSAIGQVLLLGKSRTALEIVRLTATLKAKQWLLKKYKWKLEEFEQKNKKEGVHEPSDKVWICWFQGMQNAPDIVRKCYQSVVENLADKEIILITSENMLEYVEFPDFIVQKWKDGYISHTHMTDLLRLELLTRYGGLWLDATVYVSGNNIPEYLFSTDLFFFQNLKPGRDGNASYISSWLIAAKTNNKILMATKELCYEYWKKNNYMIDYFLLHDFMSIVLDYYDEDWKRVVPCDNSTPHILLLRLFDEYDQTIWSATKEKTAFHKLSYKFEKKQTEIAGTYYDILLK